MFVARPSSRSSSSKSVRTHPYGDREKKEEDKKEDYILLGDTTDIVCDEQICNNVKYDEDENSDYNNYVFELLNSLVKQHDQQYDQQSDESLHAKFERVVSSPIVRTSKPATYPFTKMPSDLVQSRSTQKRKIYEYDTRAEDNKYKKFSDRLFTVTEFENRDGRTIVPSQKMSSTNVIDNTKCTLSEQTIEGKNIKLVIERENKYFRHNYPHTPPYQRAIYFKFYIGLQEYFHCTFIISSENDKTYCTSVHYTTRLGGNPVYIYIDLDTIISVFENDCQSDVIKFLVVLLENFKDNDDETQKSRKFKCFLGIMACNSGIDAAELQTIINKFTDTLKEEQGMVGGKLKNRKKTTTAKPKTNTAKPKTTTAKPKTTTAKPKTTTAKPKTTTAKPKTTTAKPKTTTAKPKTTTAKPKTTTSKSRNPK